MALLTPTNFDREVALLNKVGIETGRKLDSVEERFNYEMMNGGLSPEEIVGTISQVMNSGENAGVKLAAAKLALSMHMHPAFVPRKEAEKKETPVITINIGGGNLELGNILRPQTTIQGIYSNVNDE
jgi:hypothetical protein